MKPVKKLVTNSYGRYYPVQTLHNIRQISEIQRDSPHKKKCKMQSAKQDASTDTLDSKYKESIEIVKRIFLFVLFLCKFYKGNSNFLCKIYKG